ncbi:MAG: hypothetical protein GWO16_12165 [Gammaproteobacteria bacterium]|nr:hypothetical protein [Gammaproteobacteria bacterium]NIR98681.1 hypothetical protein [Gammaproteobacteria bacterium]NIT64393.1 hypothetical protein [Gammaproteobacteria bacterium]NIV19492.1 hypothetical protein [Gammaproteobacteria bacterium]NIY32973.1 hypothetical protein [Gammaproteobacteria bacterium]
MNVHARITLVLLAVTARWAAADAIPFHKYRLLREGMSEGQVLLRVGEPDRETVISNDYIYRKIWYYLPDGRYSGDWLTVITFDANGKVIRLERSKP